MGAHAVGNAVDARLRAKVDRQPARPPKRGRVELEPARRASARKPPVRNHDIGPSAGFRERLPVDQRARPSREQPPFASAFA